LSLWFASHCPGDGLTPHASPFLYVRVTAARVQYGEDGAVPAHNSLLSKIFG